MRAEGTTPKHLANLPALKKIGEWVAKAAKYPGVILDSNGKPMVDTGKGDTLDTKGRPIIVTEAAKAIRERRIRFLLVAGWAEVAVSNIDLGWTVADWKTFKDILTRPIELDEAGTTGSFITPQEMEFIDKTIIGRNAIGVYKKLGILESIRIARQKNYPIILKPSQGSYDV
jgi:hypothetical protein